MSRTRTADVELIRSRLIHGDAAPVADNGDKGGDLIALDVIKDLLEYWKICMKSKDVPNVVRYSTGEEAVKTLARAYAKLRLSCKWYNHNRAAKSWPDKDSVYYYPPQDIVRTTVEADEALSLGIGIIITECESPFMACRLERLYDLISICEATMRGWRISISSRGGRC